MSEITVISLYCEVCGIERCSTRLPVSSRCDCGRTMLIDGFGARSLPRPAPLESLRAEVAARIEALEISRENHRIWLEGLNERTDIINKRLDSPAPEAKAVGYVVVQVETQEVKYLGNASRCIGTLEEAQKYANRTDYVAAIHPVGPALEAPRG